MQLKVWLKSQREPFLLLYDDNVILGEHDMGGASNTALKASTE